MPIIFGFYIEELKKKSCSRSAKTCIKMNDNKSDDGLYKHLDNYKRLYYKKDTIFEQFYI